MLWSAPEIGRPAKRWTTPSTVICRRSPTDSSGWSMSRRPNQTGRNAVVTQ